MANQRTLKTQVACKGVGLHSGINTTMILAPAPEDAGIVFERVDLEGARVEANLDNTVASRLCTVLSKDGAEVRTVEHVLAALAGTGVDNVLVRLDGPEIPAMDGSALPFVRLIRRAGLEEQQAKRRLLRVTQPIEVRDGDKSIRAYPYPGLRFSCVIEYAHPVLRRQAYAITLQDGQFTSQLARARTFGFLKDAGVLRKNGFARGASVANVLLIGRDRVINGGLRFSNEFVRHKILDIIGDLCLLGMPLLGHVVANKAGHSLNRQLAAKLRESTDHWQLVE